MKKLLVAVVVCLVAGTLFADGASLSFAGRNSGTLGTSLTFETAFSHPVRVTSIAISFPTPYTGSLTISAKLDGTVFNWTSNAVSGVSTIIFNPTTMWVKPSASGVPRSAGDTVIIWCSTTANAKVTVDYEN